MMLGAQKRKPTFARESGPPSVAALLGVLLGLWALTEAILYLRAHGSDVVLSGAASAGGGAAAPLRPVPDSIHVVLTSNGNSCARAAALRPAPAPDARRQT